MKGVPHYFKNGTLFTGETHKMNGQLHSGASHSKDSKQLFHFKELASNVQKRILVKHLKTKAKMKNDKK